MVVVTPGKEMGSHRLNPQSIYASPIVRGEINALPSAEMSREKKSSHRAKKIRAPAANYSPITIGRRAVAYKPPAPVANGARPVSHGYCARRVMCIIYRAITFLSILAEMRCRRVWDQADPIYIIMQTVKRTHDSLARRAVAWRGVRRGA